MVKEGGELYLDGLGKDEGAVSFGDRKGSGGNLEGWICGGARSVNSSLF